LGGTGGSGGGTGQQLIGGLYGGGGGTYNDRNQTGPAGQSGAVRIIWGAGRAFPATNTQDV
jgi:hypothetical protein